MPIVGTSTQRITQHRQKLREEGLRPVQFWVPDTRRPDFAATLAAQCRSLRGDSQETEILAFTQTAASTIENWES